MNEITRRGAIGGAVAASAVGAVFPAQTRAAGPVASKQAAGFYRYNVGDIQVTVSLRAPFRCPMASLPTPTRRR
jgi:hypothetical protein